MSFTYLCILMSLLGFFMVPVMPLSFELACELSFPVGEAIAAGMLVTGGQLIGIIIVNF
jgi:FLVCR family MFS transporter 7